MKSRELVLNVLYKQGVNDALDLRNRASDMDGTSIIEEEDKIPMFDPEKDYTGWKTGSPVCDMVDGCRQVFTLLIPHNASHYPDVRPNNNRALWSLTHTKDPEKAKNFITPAGTSGLYMNGECCVFEDENGVSCVWRSLADNNPYTPLEYPANWTKIS